MPLLQTILHQLDGELDRLQALRKIVAGLSHTTVLVRRLTAAVPTVTAATVAPIAVVETVKPTRTARSDAGKPRGPQKSKPAEQSRALARTVPSGPVVFYPQKPSQPEPVTTPSASPEQTSTAAPADLDAASRKLAALWTAGFAS